MKKKSRIIKITKTKKINCSLRPKAYGKRISRKKNKPQIIVRTDIFKSLNFSKPYLFDVFQKLIHFSP